MAFYNTPKYRRSRRAYVAQCTFEYFITVLVSDAFLAKLLSSIGISDSLIGIISSFLSLAFIFQLLSLFVTTFSVNKKKTVIAFNIVSQIMFCMLYLIPFLPLNKRGKTVLIMLGVLFAYVAQYIAAPILFQWANSYVDPFRRARYSAIKEIVSLFSGMVFSSVLGYAIDRYERLGNINGAFLFISSTMLVTALLNLTSLILIKGDGKKQERVVPGRMVKETLENKKFRKLVVMAALWNCALYFSVGFWGVFKTKDLLLSVFAVQLINIAGQFARLLLSVPFGRYSDKNGFAKGFELAAWIAAAGFLVNIFITRRLWPLIILQTMCYHISMAGTNQNSFNIAYSYVNAEYISQAMAIKNSVGGICGFIAALIAGKIVSGIRDSGNMLFGIPVLPQQVLSVISLAFTMATIVYMKKNFSSGEEN